MGSHDSPHGAIPPEPPDAGLCAATPAGLQALTAAAGVRPHLGTGKGLSR